MGVTGKVKRGFTRAFVVFGSLAVLLNVVAAAASFKRDLWTMGLGYLVIASGLTAALVIHWYAQHRQAPYSWRERVPEIEQDDWAGRELDDDAYADDLWGDDDPDDWPIDSWRRDPG